MIKYLLYAATLLIFVLAASFAVPKDRKTVYALPKSPGATYAVGSDGRFSF